MKVAVFGAGYVGLVQSAVLAEVGHQVIGVDVDKDKVSRITQGDIPIFEPGLSSIITQCVARDTLSFTTDAKKAIDHADIIFIAVGTPPDEDGSADLKHVIAVSETIGSLASERKIVVTKSTVPVGTSDKVNEALKRSALAVDSGVQFSVVSNPEFLKEGSAVNDCKRPDRIIVGSTDKNAIEAMKALYAPFNRNHDRVIVMDVRSAELTKYAANCMLATKISFMNEMSNIAERFGADIEAVRRGIGSDPRIGFQFIYPGCGYGGSCFPKDVSALIRSSQEVGMTPSILNAVELVNQKQKSKLTQYIEQHYGYMIGDDRVSVEGKKAAVWGLSFKPNTDDMREAPSITLIRDLLNMGVTVVTYDPEAMEEAKRIFGDEKCIEYVDNHDACLDDADFLVLCTEWEEFRSPDFDMLASQLGDKVIFDGRNVYSPDDVESAGIAYYGIGRGRSLRATF